MKQSGIGTLVKWEYN